MTQPKEVAPTGVPLAAVRTFLLVDLRGYTAYTRQFGDEAAAHLSQQFLATCHDVIGSFGGEVFGSAGDQALAAFSSARQALRAAVTLQARPSAEKNPASGLPLEAGIGLDAGEAIQVGGDYRGSAVNLASRLCAIAGPGEVFATEGVIHLAQRIDGLAFHDRGTVRLKGMAHPVRVIQVTSEEAIPNELPPLEPVPAARRSSLPDEPTPFIGRKHEIEAVTGLLREPAVRLVTLTGPGGTGKTRLALQVGAAVLHGSRDGVFLVSLAPLATPDLVPSTIAETLGVAEEGGTPLAKTLTEHLADRRLLLILDNFEHLPDASTFVASLLDACRELHILVTSRIPLHLSREREYAVPPLSLPDLHHLPDPEQMAQVEAIALFVDRAQAVRADFALDGNASAVAEICVRLDGLPLAIELAAARIKLFPPQALLTRLDHRLQLLTGGAKDRPGRQQTLRNTVDWSYSLLSPEEQAFFARLSVFSGGCSFEAVDAVCNPDGDLDVLESVTSLVDKSLVRQEGTDEPRFAMLETIREYAAERLAERHEVERLRERHARYYLTVVESAQSELTGRRQGEYLGRLDREYDNLRAALGWAMETGAMEVGLRLAVSLVPFWSARSHPAEGRRWLDEMLEAATQKSDVSPSLWIRALVGAAILATDQGALGDAAPLGEQAVSLARRQGTDADLILALNTQALRARQTADYREAAELYREVLTLAERNEDRAAAAAALGGLSLVTAFTGDPAASRSLGERSVALFRELGDIRSTADGLNGLSQLAQASSDYERADELGTESLILFRSLGDPGGTAQALFALATLATRLGDYQRAEEMLEESIALRRERGDSRGAAMAQGVLGAVELNLGKPAQARATISSAVKSMRQHADPWALSTLLAVFGHVELDTGDVRQALEYFAEAAELCLHVGNRFYLPWVLDGLARSAVAQRKWDLAAHLYGAAEAATFQGETNFPPVNPAASGRAAEATRAALGEDGFGTATALGRDHPVESLISEALAALQ